MPEEQHPVEVIMARSLMTNLTTPAFLVDPEGSLIFFNDAAGEILGVRYEEAGPMGPEEWGTRFEPVDAEGRPLPVENLPLSIAIRGSAAHTFMRIRSSTGDEREIEVSAFPIVGRSGQHAAMAIFWVREES